MLASPTILALPIKTTCQAYREALASGRSAPGLVAATNAAESFCHAGDRDAASTVSSVALDLARAALAGPPAWLLPGANGRRAAPVGAL
ncbi:MAG: hypothetical protein IPO19_03060 [Rhodoferax sp.]|nr:hypothetical protein [Rhodoferax sp.]